MVFYLILYGRAGEIGVNTSPSFVHLQIKIDKDSWILQYFNNGEGGPLHCSATAINTMLQK